MNSPTNDEMISVNCCFFPFVWCGRRSGVCVSDVMNTHTELHSMCLCNLFFYILFFSTLTFLCRLTLRQTNAFFSDFCPTSVSLLRVCFPFNSQAVCLTYSFLWSSSHLHLCEKCQAVIKLFFLSLENRDECECVCACDFISFQYMNTYGFWFVAVTFFYFYFLACSSVAVVFVVSLFLWSCVLQMERMLFRKFTPRHRVNIHIFVFVWCG